MNAAIYVIDHGEFPPVDLNGYLSRILAEVEKARDEVQGISFGLRVMPSFRKALFAVNGKCFIAELQTVYIGKNGESRREPFIGSSRIGEMYIKPIENRDAIRLVALNVITQTESLAKVFKVAAERFRETVSSFESLGVNLERVENKTIHNR